MKYDNVDKMIRWEMSKMKYGLEYKKLWKNLEWNIVHEVRSKEIKDIEREYNIDIFERNKTINIIIDTVFIDVRK